VSLKNRFFVMDSKAVIQEMISRIPGKGAVAVEE
jgi:hypothetical protein